MSMTDSREKVKYHKQTFDNISEEKRRSFLDVSVTHFARDGYAAANINNIAKDAGISIGSLYNYFASKEDLYMGVINEGITILEKALVNIVENDNIVIFLEEMLNAAREFCLKYPRYNQIYLDLTTNSLCHLSARLCGRIEDMSVKRYKEVITRSVELGYARKDLNVDMTAYCLDNLVMMYHFSYASDYYQERLRAFLGDSLRDEDMIGGMVEFARRGLI